MDDLTIILLFYIFDSWDAWGCSIRCRALLCHAVVDGRICWHISFVRIYCHPQRFFLYNNSLSLHMFRDSCVIWNKLCIMNIFSEGIDFKIYHTSTWNHFINSASIILYLKLLQPHLLEMFQPLCSPEM